MRQASESPMAMSPWPNGRAREGRWPPLPAAAPTAVNPASTRANDVAKPEKAPTSPAAKGCSIAPFYRKIACKSGHAARRT